MKNKKIFNYIAGCCFVALLCKRIFPLDEFAINAINIACTLAYVIIVISLFTSYSPLMPIGSAILAANEVRVSIRVLDFIFENYDLLKSSVFDDVGLIVIFVMLFIVGLNLKKLNKIPFLVVAFATSVIRLIPHLGFNYKVLYAYIKFGTIGTVADSWLFSLETLIFDFLLYIIATLMILLYELNLAKKTTPIDTNSKVNQTSNEFESQMDRLTKLKSLLDNGAITQEEFDEKKKEILG